MKLKDVKTIWEFRDFLAELANKNPALFAPLSFHYQILLQRHKTFIRLIVIVHFFAGLLIGLIAGGR